MGTSVREAEHQIDVGLFLDEYPQWELGTSQQSVILHEMFYMLLTEGRKRQNVCSAGDTGAAPWD